MSSASNNVTAPLDGIVTARNTDIGALVQAGDNSGPKELFHMATIQQLRDYIPVLEIYATSVKTGEKVKLTLHAFPGETFAGTIVRNADAIDATSRTLNVEVDVDNPSARLLPGAYAFVHVRVPPSNGSVTLPSNALLFRAQGLCRINEGIERESASIASQKPESELVRGTLCEIGQRRMSVEDYPGWRILAAASVAAIYRTLPRGAQPSGQRQSDLVSFAAGGKEEDGGSPVSSTNGRRAEVLREGSGIKVDGTAGDGSRSAYITYL